MSPGGVILISAESSNQLFGMTMKLALQLLLLVSTLSLELITHLFRTKDSSLFVFSVSEDGSESHVYSLMAPSDVYVMFSPCFSSSDRLLLNSFILMHWTSLQCSLGTSGEVSLFGWYICVLLEIWFLG
uniref:Uncharacterized protein n=1 Tax=Zea mays TaxID=4577 RepID=A0A804QCP3_MAIZE